MCRSSRRQIHSRTDTARYIAVSRRNGMNPTTTNHRKELAHRSSDGIEVFLYWNERTNRVTLRVDDARSDAAFEVAIDGPSALDAFRHPFVYAASAATGTSALETDRLAA
jgi:hypothetical protein